ncbi:M1 family metallopeptidase [Amycolatopsis magusensis]|uniref:Aminopeptidase N n=1 Tax=Amycolatopsis magusensis TaxID=882444 RepID=A0ABS4PIH2_9PSEU|nr:M1 family metallopeptidase [Amycolatopsis magusensis]MBP2179221.1 aminopeptidase N [Amycolatopsis magusensis]
MRRRQYLVLCGLVPLIIGCSPGGPDAPASDTIQPGVASAGAPGAGDPAYPNDGNGGYDALGYDVSITYDPPAQRLDGDTTVTAKATQDLNRFNLDLRGLDVASVEVDGQQAEFTRESDFELVITPAQTLATGRTFKTRVRYSGVPGTGEEGLGAGGWHPSPSGGAYVVGQPHSAAYWYPVNETPRDKATFRVTARVPEGWSVVSGGVEEQTATADGWTTSTWRDDTPVASYLTTVAIDRFTFERSTLPDGKPLVNAYAPGAEEQRSVAARTAEAVEFLASRFGPYPQTATGGIYTDDRIGYSLETQGRPTYANWADLETVVHELAHQWYGNSVSVRDWSDVCLNECVASYSQWLWAEAKEGADLDEQYHSTLDRTRESTRLWSAKLHEATAGAEFDGVYDKGILAMHALRRTIGDEPFAAALKEWPALHKDGNATWREFEAFIAEKAGRTDLAPFFDAWFRGTTLPDDEHLYPGSLRR